MNSESYQDLTILIFQCFGFAPFLIFSVFTHYEPRFTY